MPDAVAAGGAALGRPARAFVAVVPAGVETQPGDDEEDVAGFRIHADPFSKSARTVAAEALRRSKTLEQSRFAQHVGRRAGAIVA